MWFPNLVTLLCLALASSCKADCLSKLPAPIQIPIRNVPLPNGLLERGAAFSIGTPPQPLAFGLTMQWQNTFVYDASSPCDNPVKSLSPIQCSARHGGFFDEGSSKTWKQAANMSASGAVPDADQGDAQLAKDVWGTDTFDMNSTLALEDFPIGIARTASLSNEIGLARNSTFISALFSKEAIASRSWGLSVGWQGADPIHQVDGSLVLGGYDAAKTSGNNFTYPISGNTSKGACPGGLVVTIGNIALNLKDGSSPSLLPPSAGSVMQACVDPAFSLLQLPKAIFKSFLDATNHTGEDQLRSVGNNFQGMLFQSQEAYDGDMTISVSPGLDIRIPNHQLILPDYSFNAQGFLTEPDPTTRVLLINSLDGENANDMPVLGRPFLSSSYLFVDQDHAQFALWSGNPTAEKNIIPIGDAATCSPDVGTTTPSSTAPVPAPAPASKNPNADQNINTGGIAGVVVGSLAGIVIVSLLFFRYYRQHRQHRSRQSRKANITKAEKEDLRLSASYLSFKPEMPTDRQPPQELPVERNPGYAVTPYEMAVEPHEMAAGSAGGSLKQGKRDHRAPGERKGKERQGRTERL